MENVNETEPKDIPIASTSKNPFVSDIMSTSYSEITDAACSQNYEKMDVGEDLLDEEVHEKNRPDSLYYDNMEFTVDENNMKHYIAEDLQYQIKIASPTSQQSPFNNLPKQLSTTLPPQMDINTLADLEIEAQYLAANIDNLTENLTNLLHSISAITADNVEVYKSSVSKLTDVIDANIKSMYSIIAKSEEISKSMKKAEQLAVRIKDIRRLVDMFEQTL